jgi:hypothetical protein
MSTDASGDRKIGESRDLALHLWLPFDFAQGLERLLVGGAKRADYTAETSASGGPSLQSVRAYCYDAVRENRLHNIPLIIDRGQSADQMANAI